MVVPARRTLDVTDAVSKLARLPDRAHPRSPGPGSSAPYQDAMIRCAIETGGGSRTSPPSIAARSSVPAEPAGLGDLVGVDPDLLAAGGVARNPSIRLCGIGQGWLPRYRTPSTVRPVSSSTSRATACSADSPGSTNPARIETRRGGPLRVPGQQAAVVGIGDQHDHGRVDAAGSARCRPPGSAGRARTDTARSAHRSAGSARASHASWPARPRASSARHPGRTAAGPASRRLAARIAPLGCRGGLRQLGSGRLRRSRPRRPQPAPSRNLTPSGARAGRHEVQLAPVVAEPDQRLPVARRPPPGCRGRPRPRSATRCRRAGGAPGPPRRGPAPAAPAARAGSAPGRARSLGPVPSAVAHRAGRELAGRDAASSSHR